MKILRRAHMYAGLALTPFVLLYGATAFLFNHPDGFSDRSVRPISTADTAGTPLATFPAPGELAEAVVAAINRGGTSPVALERDQAPVYTRDLALTARGPGVERIIFVELEGRAGTIRSAPAPPESPTPPWARAPVPIDPAPAESARAAVATILARRGGRGEEVRIRTAPELVFAVRERGAAWRVAYDLRTGTLTVRPRTPTISTRRFLTALHLACRYPSALDVRWFWALLVDAMAAAMVFWAISGMFMWWQMKKLRGWGGLALAASVVAASALAIGMHQVLASRG